MSDNVRVSFGVNQKRRPVDGHRQEPGSRTRQKSLFLGLEYVRRAPSTRPGTVKDLRRRIASGSWNPTTTGVAEKILYEHLFDPATL